MTIRSYFHSLNTHLHIHVFWSYLDFSSANVIANGFYVFICCMYALKDIKLPIVKNQQHRSDQYLCPSISKRCWGEKNMLHFGAPPPPRPLLRSWAWPDGFCSFLGHQEYRSFERIGHLDCNASRPFFLRAPNELTLNHLHCHCCATFSVSGPWQRDATTAEKATGWNAFLRGQEPPQQSPTQNIS